MHKRISREAESRDGIVGGRWIRSSDEARESEWSKGIHTTVIGNTVNLQKDEL
jgi:hypothetical protein